MKKISNILCITILGLIFTSVFTNNANAVIIGDALIDRSTIDTALGSVYIYDGNFGINGVATTFQFFNNEIQDTDHWVTPLIFKNISSTDFVLQGIGTSRNNSGSGIQAYDFGLIAGHSCPNYAFLCLLRCCPN